jgi:hypothetical protein
MQSNTVAVLEEPGPTIKEPRAKACCSCQRPLAPGAPTVEVELRRLPHRDLPVASILVGALCPGCATIA